MMGCRICIDAGAAALNRMPVDLSLLLGTSSPTQSLLLHQQRGGGFESAVVEGGGCRRTASFPLVSQSNGVIRYQPESLSILKYSPLEKNNRSLSESASLNLVCRQPQHVVTLEQFKQQLSLLDVEVKQQQRCSLASEEESDESAASSDDDAPAAGASSPPAEETTSITLNGVRKKVSFADDKGLELITVRIMTEPSDVPPKLSPSVLRALLGEESGVADDDALPASSWALDFVQPASDYAGFRQRVERQNVALENVLLKNERRKMIGTIKVKNVAFEKAVFVRLTDDGWASFYDRPAVYRPCGRAADLTNTDTFGFDVELPMNDGRRQRVEFCVGYRAAGVDFWDSNAGNNYALVSQQQTNTAAMTPQSAPPQADPFLMQRDNWAKFASWKDISSETPYW